MTSASDTLFYCRKRTTGEGCLQGLSILLFLPHPCGSVFQFMRQFFFRVCPHIFEGKDNLDKTKDGA